MDDTEAVRPLRVEPFDNGARWPEMRSWYFRLLAANGEIIAQSEGYTSAEERDETMRLIVSTPIVIEGAIDGA